MKSTFARVGLAIVVVIVAFVALTSRFTGSALAAGPSAVPAPAVDNALARAPGEETAVFAGGCFWGIQAVYQHVKGGSLPFPGYAGGHVGTPSYEEVSSGTTGHADRCVSSSTRRRFLTARPPRLFRSRPRSDAAQSAGARRRNAVSLRDLLHRTVHRRGLRLYLEQLGKRRSSAGRSSGFRHRTFTVAEDYHQNYATLHPDDLYIRINDARESGRAEVGSR